MKKKKIDIKTVFQAEEIELKYLFLIFWERRSYLLYSILGCWALAIIALVTSPTEYVSTSTKISEVADKGGGSKLGGLSDLLGGGGGGESSSSDLTSPSMYPKFVASQQFLLDLMYEKFYFESRRDTLTLYRYLSDYQDRDLVGRGVRGLLELPGEILDLFERKKTRSKDTTDTENLLRISKAQFRIMAALKQRINISTEGTFITVEVTMPEAKVSARCNEFIFKKLIDFVTEQQTAKERRDLIYAEQKAAKAKERYEEAEVSLAKFLDANRGIITSSAEIEGRRLESLFNIHLNIYRSLAVQVEQLRLKLDEVTPLYTEFEPVYVPFDPKIPYQSKIIIYTILGVFIGFTLIVRDIYRNIRGAK